MPLASTSKCRCGPVERPVEADIGNMLARQHQIADLRDDPRRVAVAGHQTIAVIDVDRIAVTRFLARENDTAARCRENRRAGFRDQIDTRMKIQMMRERIAAVTERRAEARAVGGHATRERGVGHRVIGGLVFECRQRTGQAVQLLASARGIGVTCAPASRVPCSVAAAARDRLRRRCRSRMHPGGKCRRDRCAQRGPGRMQTCFEVTQRIDLLRQPRDAGGSICATDALSLPS